MSNDSRHRVLEKVECCYQIAEEQLSKAFPRPDITFNQRGKIAGSARLQLNQLRFNPVLLEDNLQEFLQQVVPHEVAHLLVFQCYGRVKPHGQEWQRVMRELFSVSPTTTHKMNVDKVMGQTFEYFCACGPVQLTIRRHHAAKKGRQYQCRACGSLLSRETVPG